jgi:predicted PurR-regulated permease PerM
LGLSSIILGFLIDYGVIKNSLATEIIDLILLVILTPAGIVVNAFLQNKIDNWVKIIKDIKQCIDQVYVIWLKAATDNVITDDELVVFGKIFTQTDAQIKIDENTSALTDNVLQQVESIFSNAAVAIQALAKKP